MPRIDIYTDAPERFDGFGAKTVATIGTLDGREVRIVAIDAVHGDWLTARYASGCRLAATEEEFRCLFAGNVKPLKVEPDYSPRERLAVYASELLAAWDANDTAGIREEIERSFAVIAKATGST